MGTAQKGGLLAVFTVLSLVGGFLANVVTATWRTDDRIAAKAAEAGRAAGADAAREIVKNELGAAIGAAVAASVKPISDEVIRHGAMDDERQRATDRRIESLEGQKLTAHAR